MSQAGAKEKGLSPGDLQRVLALARVAKAKKTPNPYKSDFKAFLSTMVYTRDEADGGKVKPFPAHWPLWDDLIDDVLREPILMVEKSRRVLASWFMCAFDLWVIAGGYDPRWPQLMPTDQNPDGGNRQVVIAARKLEDAQGSAWWLAERHRFLYDQIIDRDFHKTHWPGFPTIDFRYNWAKASNGGRFDAVPQGADQLRGITATVCHMEEVGFWSELKPSITGALPTIKGGGRIVMVTTAAAGTYAAELALGTTS
jgi:hypothetical protein